MNRLASDLLLCVRLTREYTATLVRDNAKALTCDEWQAIAERLCAAGNATGSDTDARDLHLMALDCRDHATMARQVTQDRHTHDASTESSLRITQPCTPHALARGVK